MKNYVCKIANFEEMNAKWDYQISIAKNKDNWKIWKKENIDMYNDGYIIPYYGVLDGVIICEATAYITSKSVSCVHDCKNLIGNGTVYLSAFRTNKEYQGKGYFSKLFKYMISDLKLKGYKKATLGVEPDEIRNKEIYMHYGFNEHIKDAIESYPDGTKIVVEYYGKSLI